MGILGFSLKATEDAQKSGKEDALDILLDLSMNMSVQLRVLLMAYTYIRG